MSICKIEGCGRKLKAKEFCSKHYARFLRNGNTDLLVREYGTGTFHKNGYIMTQIDLITKFDHVRIAEKALGKELPKGAVVHHVDGNPRNNDHKNLVICPNQKYHGLLHKRQRALGACGHADWLKCKFCNRYDYPEFMYVSSKETNQTVHHRNCHKQYQQNKRRNAKRMSQMPLK